MGVLSLRSVGAVKGALLVLAFAGFLAAPAGASFFLGDLVYCDVNADGVFDAGDFPLNGVSVHVECVDANGDTCVDVVDVTGGPLDNVSAEVLGAFDESCDVPGGKTFDPLNPAELDGRYLVSPWEPDGSRCALNTRPWTCTVTLDQATAPADCNILVTPLAGGPPFDGNSDGDFCDCTRDVNGFCTSPAGDTDGPFPEGQPLGNLPSQGGCEDFACPAPGDGVFIDGFQGVSFEAQERCGLQNDFGLTPDQGGGGQGCTPGYWKQSHHFDSWVGYDPSDSFADVFGVPYERTLLRALRTGGGQERALGRHAVAALLNSSNGDVSYLFSTAEVIAIVQDAWATGEFEAAKNILAAENEQGCPLN